MREPPPFLHQAVVSYISDNGFALLKRTGVAGDGPNLGKTVTMLGDGFVNDGDDC